MVFSLNSCSYACILHHGDLGIEENWKILGTMPESPGDKNYSGTMAYLFLFSIFLEVQLTLTEP